MDHQKEKRKLVFITGLSGSGKTTARNVFADLGYFTVDNLPLPLTRDVLKLTAQSTESIQQVALVVDARTPEYLDEFPQTVTKLKEDFDVDVLYLDSSDDILARRFDTTRRKHPLAPSQSAIIGITKERELLTGVRESTTATIDTSTLNIHELKQRIIKLFDKSRTVQMTISTTSFGFKYGILANADLVFDVRFLQNPFFIPELSMLSGKDAAVREYVMNQEATQEFIQRTEEFLDFLIPKYEKDGKSYLTIGIGCTGGQHRSVAIAEHIHNWLEDKLGRTLRLKHRDMKQNS